MNKIAIATMTTGANYGNALQNYAVLQLIEQCGYKAETLRITTKNGYPDAVQKDLSLAKKLRPSYIRDYLHNRQSFVCGAKNDADFLPTAARELRNNASAWREAVRKKQERFSAFQRDILKYTDFEVSSLHFNLTEMEQYAAFVTGSDQVWNPHYKTNSMVEFLQFAPREKRIAFVPSFGVSEIPSSRVKEYAQWLHEIPYLSVREEAGARIIKQLTGKDVKVLLDPSFGLTREEWLSFARKPESFSHEPGSYVFCYFLGNRTKTYTKLIRQYADKHHCRIVDVYDVQQLENYCYDPREFVWLLANAKVVFTDSFHGCAFSINLKKPFVVFDRAGDGCIVQSSRITTVLEKIGLQRRKYPYLSAQLIDEIDFSQATQIVEKERKALHIFLRNSLQQAVSTKAGISLATKRHCTGCGACANACPRHAITMVADEEGFLYPQIDTSLCIQCSACEKACPADVSHLSAQHTEAFYAFSKDEETCRKSSSGGLFTELARSVIDEGGVVYGAGFDNDFQVVHRAAETLTELENLRTSKYVQSDIGDVFRQVREQLQQGRRVLFSGTPCQVAALKTFLGREYDDLLTVDIICHGVPSPGLWKAYLEQNHAQQLIKGISFRDKTFGWNFFSMKVDYADGTSYREPATKDPFERSFLANLTLRPSCYQCQYKTVDRVSDITIADYWGVESVHRELKEQQGVSLVLVHSDNGRKIMETVSDYVIMGETNLQTALRMNHAATHSVPWPEKRNMVFELVNKMPFGKAVENCLKQTISKKMKTIIIRNGVRVKRVFRKAGIIH